MNLRFGILAVSHVNNTVSRPIIMHNGVQIMFDTGAAVPVWCTGLVKFNAVFPDAVRQRFKYLLSGFGRTEQELKDFLLNPSENNINNFLMDVYQLPHFSLRSRDGEIAWKNTQVAVTSKDGIGADLILPSTMFRGMSLCFNQKSANAPFVEIETECNTKYVFVRKHDRQFQGTELLKYIYSQGEIPDRCIQADNNTVEEPQKIGF